MSSKQQGSPWPLYLQIKNLILRRIESGQWQPGTKIPSENELVESLGISRMTVNRAIRELTGEGHLLRKKGAGTFVQAHKPRFTLLKIKSIAEEIAAWGGEHDCKVILLEKVVGSDRLCREMGLPSASEVFHSLLVHRDRGIPLQLAERFVNPDLAPDYLDQDFTHITPSQYLLGVVAISEVEHVIEACLPDSQMKKHLQIPDLEPCLILHRTTWYQKVVVTRNRFIYPGSRYTLGSRFSTADYTGEVSA